jgi:DNA integrity scanning protein DisA with diadenylate cyclase activity
MEPVLIAIGALGLLGLLGVLLIAKRVGRVEQALGRLDRLEEIDRRLGDLSAEFDRKELNSLLQAKMTEVTEANRRLVHSVDELRQDLQEIKDADRQVGLQPVSVVGDEPPAMDVVVRDHLEADGYTDIQVLSDLTHLNGNSGRLVFEARRAGVMHKGHVNLKDGRVTDENVRAAYSAFP